MKIEIKKINEVQMKRARHMGKHLKSKPTYHGHRKRGDVNKRNRKHLQ
jgi:hypothetical protein